MKSSPASQPGHSLTTAQRRYFYFTAAVTGAAIMVIEVLGAKMLAPYVGTSHFVWMAQIVVTMVALACGYYIGGRWVDRSRGPGGLYVGILVAALYLCVAATQVARVANACVKFDLAIGALLASTFLFLVPLLLLATTAPFLIRFLMLSVQNVGGAVGRLTAVSTVGSIVGTVVIGYVLIPLLANSTILLVTAGVLLLVATIYFAIWGNRRGLQAAALVLASGLLCGYVSESGGLAKNDTFEELYRHNTSFGTLQVVQVRAQPRRLLLTDYLPQAFYDFERHQSLSAFAPTLHGLAWTYTRGISNALCIGLGGGLVPMELVREGTKVDVVEINPAVSPIARKYFELDTNGMNLIVGDGRPFVKQSREKYDAIVLDAFLGDATATHLFTKEAFAEMSRVLRPQGVLVINCFGGPAPGTEFSVASIHRTLTAVFRGVSAFSRSVAGDVSNVYFIASPSELTVQRQMDFAKVHPYCRQEVTDIFSMPVQFDSDHGIVLTDDYNPIEFYDAANREKVRRGMVEFMQCVMVAQH